MGSFCGWNFNCVYLLQVCRSPYKCIYVSVFVLSVYLSCLFSLCGCQSVSVSAIKPVCVLSFSIPGKKYRILNIQTFCFHYSMKDQWETKPLVRNIMSPTLKQCVCRMDMKAFLYVVFIKKKYPCILCNDIDTLVWMRTCPLTSSINYTRETFFDITGFTANGLWSANVCNDMGFIWLQCARQYARQTSWVMASHVVFFKGEYSYA